MATTHPTDRPAASVIPRGERIRERRKELGLSQAELADLVRRSQNHVCLVEQGRPTHPASLEALARQLGLAYKTVVDSAAPARRVLQKAA